MSETLPAESPTPPAGIERKVLWRPLRPFPALWRHFWGDRSVDQNSKGAISVASIAAVCTTFLGLAESTAGLLTKWLQPIGLLRWLPELVWLLTVLLLWHVIVQTESPKDAQRKRYVHGPILRLLAKFLMFVQLFAAALSLWGFISPQDSITCVSFELLDKKDRQLVKARFHHSTHPPAGTSNAIYRGRFVVRNHDGKSESTRFRIHISTDQTRNLDIHHADVIPAKWAAVERDEPDGWVYLSKAIQHRDEVTVYVWLTAKPHASDAFELSDAHVDLEEVRNE